jgi:tripartite ATP-independent transporter DctM subunit
MEKDERTPLSHKIENVFSIAILILLSVLPVLEVIVRKVFRTGIPASGDYIIHLVLWITFLGGMITSRENRHLALSAGIEAIKKPIGMHIRAFNGFIGTAFTTAFAWSSLSFMLIGFDSSMRVGLIPIQIVVGIMPVGYAVMAGRFIRNTPSGGGKKLIAGLGILFGTFFSLASIINFLFFFFFNLPMFFDTLLMFSQTVMQYIAIPAIIVLVVSMISGTPLFVVLGGVAFMLFARQAAPLEIIANESYTMLIGKSLPAIPLFTLTGFFLSESNAGKRFVNLFQSFFGWLPGGLVIMAVLVSTFFTTFTGASGVTILALGALLYYVLYKSGKYSENYSRGLLTSAGSVGILFPPSLPIIIYGVTAQINIKHMFLGGIMPGLLMVLALAGTGVFMAVRAKVKPVKFELNKALTALKDSVWEVMLPIIVLASYFGGLTTLVETGAIAVVYAFVVEVGIKRDLKLTDLPNVFKKCIPIIGGVLVILAAAKGLSYFLIDAQIPTRLTDWVEATIHSKYVFLILLNFALLLTGMLMDIFSAIMVVVPLIIPLGNLFGIHPVHLGAIFLANLELGYLTPPVGLNLFLASYRFDKPLTQISRNILPFFLIMLIVVLLVTYLPWFSTAFVPAY